MKAAVRPLLFQDMARYTKLYSKRARAGMIFVLPALLLLLLFKVCPIFMALFASFTEWSTTKGFQRFVGLANYAYLMKDPIFKQSLYNTIIFAITLTVIQILLAFFLAFLLYRTSFCTIVYRLIIFHPYAISISIASLIWWIMYAEWGLINSLIVKLGVQRQAWLSSPSLALWALIIMLVWKGIGYWMMVLIAGINNVPHTLREAAVIDGATTWQRLIYVEIPLLRRPIAFVFVADTIINFLLFAPPYIMTAGGPMNKTLLVPLYAYRMAFVYNDLGYAAAISTVLLFVISLVVAVELKIFSSRVVY